MKGITIMFEEFNQLDELNVDAFIRVTTEVIWNKKMIGAIYECYTEETVIHGADGVEVVGADAIVADTMAWLTAFPDLEIIILDVIWGGNPTDGYRASMPWRYVGTNTGHSQFGPPTNNKLTAENNLGVANTLIKKVNDKWTYVEEWSTYDMNARRRACTMP